MLWNEILAMAMLIPFLGFLLLLYCTVRAGDPNSLWSYLR